LSPAASDFAALAIARGLQGSAAALLAEDEQMQNVFGLVRAGGLVRP
jgi:hypothetical protein